MRKCQVPLSMALPQASKARFLSQSLICADSDWPFPLLLFCAVMFSHLAYCIGKHWSLFSSKKCKGV